MAKNDETTITSAPEPKPEPKKPEPKPPTPAELEEQGFAADKKRPHEAWFARKGSKIEQGPMVYAMAKVQHGWAIGFRLTEKDFDDKMKASGDHPFGDVAKAGKF